MEADLLWLWNFSRKENMRNVYTVDVADDAVRIEEAYGAILNLNDDTGQRRSATPHEIEGAIFNWLEAQTHDYERRKDAAAFTPPQFELKERYN